MNKHNDIELVHVNAAVSQRPFIDHASFEETHHRTPDGVSANETNTWRTRANNKTLTIKRK
tara:strand:- start:548 stop:730 length:183 start_codon:yes stop_codon:yes gene_type:complete